jgi:arylsulfatase A-like enzyme
VSRALRFIEDYREKPFLLYLHLWDPHSPYGPPPPYDALHDDGSTPDAGVRLDDVKAHAPEYYESFLDDMKLKRPDDYNYIVSQYDGEISYCDAQIGRITQRLKELDLWDDTIIVLLSDHGECFGEGGVYFDHHGLYDAVVRVALMCRVPGGRTGRERAMVTTEDLLPTLAELTGWPLPEYSLTGQSFAPALCGAAFAGRDYVVSVESTRQASICLRTGQWKLIEPITHTARGEIIPDIYGRPRADGVLLFDLEHDPAEKRDVSDQYPDVRDQLQKQLHAWRAAEIARRGDDPLAEYGLSLPYDDFMTRLNARNLRG